MYNQIFLSYMIVHVLTSSSVFGTFHGIMIIIIIMETRSHIPSQLLKLRAHVVVFLFCHCGPAGTLSDMTSVPSEPGVTSFSHRCHGFYIVLCVQLLKAPRLTF